jgi:hypothetical protein
LTTATAEVDHQKEQNRKLTTSLADAQARLAAGEKEQEDVLVLMGKCASYSQKRLRIDDVFE